MTAEGTYQKACARPHFPPRGLPETAPGNPDWGTPCRVSALSCKYSLYIFFTCCLVTDSYSRGHVSATNVFTLWHTCLYSGRREWDLQAIHCPEAKGHEVHPGTPPLQLAGTVCQVGIQDKAGMCFPRSVVNILRDYQQSDDIKEGSRAKQSMKLSLCWVQKFALLPKPKSFLYLYCGIWHICIMSLLYLCFQPSKSNLT